MNLDRKHFSFLKSLITLEEREENEQIRDEFLNLTPEERELRGKALLSLSIHERHFSPAGHFLVTFEREHEKELPLFSLEVGDIVSLFPHRSIDVEFPQGTVYEKSSHTLTVAFHHDLPEWTEEERFMQLHKSLNKVTYKRMREALESLLESENTRLSYLRDISLGLVKPRAEKLPALQWFDTGLNASQKEAVKKALSAQDVMLVHGPPGTGKTTALIELIRQAVKVGQSVFATAPSNTACDNILEMLVARGIRAVRLGHPARITEGLREHTLDFKLALHPEAAQAVALQNELERLFHREERYRDRRSPGRQAERELREDIAARKDDIKKLKKGIFEKVMNETEVFVGTPTGIMDRALSDQQFDLLVFDEATQATEPMSWIPIVCANKVVMAGDHFQLPPTVRSKEAEEKGLGVTLFERFYDILEDGSKQLLERQYRMHRVIMGFSSKEFYKGLLVADESVAERTLAGLLGVKKCDETKAPLLYIDTAGKGFEEKLEEGSESRYNIEEAGLVLSELKKYLDLGVPPSEIAVISPYSAQVRWLTSKSPDKNIEVDSVDGFQGREKELVIVSLVRSNLEGEIGFLNDTRRMNVAMTRARRKLIVIGDSATLSSLKFYKDFIQYAEEVGGYKSAWELEK